MKAHKFARNITLTIFLCMILITGCAMKKDASSIQRSELIDFANSLSHEAVVNKLQSHSWAEEKDPSILMTYCEALVETRRELPSGLKSPALPSHISAFAHGAYLLSEGKFIEASEVFREVSKIRGGEVWGYLGLLEADFRTENVFNMKNSLGVLTSATRKDSSAVPPETLAYYTAWYYFHMGRFEDVARLIKEKVSQIDPVDLSELQATLFMRDDQFDAAHKIIRSMPERYQRTAVLESRLMRIQNGPEKWVEYLKEKNTRYPQFPIIEMQFGEALIEVGQTEAGLDVLRKLAQKRSFDPFTQLSLATNLLYNKREEEARRILGAGPHNPIFLPFPYYNVLLARIYFSAGQEKTGQEHLSIALKLFPKSPDALWLSYRLAMKGNDYNSAQEAINDILATEPNDISALIANAELYYFRKEWHELLSVEAKISGSPRYVGKEARDKVNTWKALAFANQGKFGDADKVLSKVADSKVKDKAAIEIEKIKQKKRGN